MVPILVDNYDGDLKNPQNLSRITFDVEESHIWSAWMHGGIRLHFPPPADEEWCAIMPGPTAKPSDQGHVSVFLANAFTTTPTQSIGIFRIKYRVMARSPVPVVITNSDFDAFSTATVTLSSVTFAANGTFQYLANTIAGVTNIQSDTIYQVEFGAITSGSWNGVQVTTSSGPVVNPGHPPNSVMFGRVGANTGYIVYYSTLRGAYEQTDPYTVITGTSISVIQNATFRTIYAGYATPDYEALLDQEQIKLPSARPQTQAVLDICARATRDLSLASRIPDFVSHNPGLRWSEPDIEDLGRFLQITTATWQELKSAQSLRQKTSTNF